MAAFGIVPEHKIISFIVSSSAIYLALLPFGLPHLGFAIGFCLFLFHLKDENYPASLIWIFVLFIYFFFLIYLGSDIKTTINNLSSMMMFPIVTLLLDKFNTRRILIISESFIKFTIRCFVVEAIIRYLWSTAVPLSEGIYRYKFHSIFFQDTNFLGLALLAIIFYIRYLEIFHGIDNRKYKLIAIILLFLSISRAAILAWIIGEILILGTNRHTLFKKLFKRVLLLSAVGFIAGTTVFVTLQEDPSFRSKLYILDLIESSYFDIRFNPLYGAGLGNSQQILGIFPHNSIALYYLETGILGLIFKAVLLIYICIKSRWRSVIVFLPYLIATQSATGYATHYLYVTLAMTTLLSHKKPQVFNRTIR